MNDRNVLKECKILVLFNAYYVFHSEETPISGGEKRFFEVIGTWNTRTRHRSVDFYYGAQYVSKTPA